MTVTVQEAEVLFTASGMTKVESASSRAKKAMDSLVSSAASAATAVGRVAAKGAKFGIAGAVAAGGAMIKLAADAETLNTQFKVLTGSQEAASKLMGEIDQFAASTPFQKMEIADAGRQLLAFGGSADTVVSELRMLGDIASGTGQPLGELAELYGKAKVQGRLFGEDINQLTGRGIPIIQALQKEFGNVDIKKLVEEGKIGFPELQRALASMTAEGGDFAGMMVEMSETTAGKWSTLQDNVTMVATKMGQELLPVANELMAWATDMVGDMDGLGAVMKDVVSAGREGFTWLSDTLQDIGIVTGVIIGDMDNLWAGLFQDIPNYAQAAFQWLQDNSGKIIDNIGIMVSNLYAKINQAGAQLGEEIAYQLGLSDEVLDLGKAQQKTLNSLTPFRAPETSKETAGVLSNIDEELARAREERAKSRADQTAQQPASLNTAAANAAAATAQEFVSQDRTAAGGKAMAQRGDASSVFNRIQDAIGGKQLKVAEKQLEVQKEFVEVGKEIASGVASLGGAFVPVLG